MESTFGRALPAHRPIGESWEIVDRPEAQSVVRAGNLVGQTLHAVLAKHAADVMGPKWPAARPFPLLVKWLDCRERLSLQVHPPAAVARELKGEAKQVSVRTVEGEMGILVGHTPLLGILVAGDVRIESMAGQIHAATIDSGFLSVDHDRVTIVAEAVEASRINA